MSYVAIEDILAGGPATALEARPVLERLKSLEIGAPRAAPLTVPRLERGQQYRFHFDMTRCIGCRCCEVACNEQNNNPPEVNWRRVGEIEGGSYPNAVRLHVSMACNHCLEPSCLEGCPVDAYEKLDNGIVAHDAETCIGCQYCTWNCPYGVPQYNAERRVVTKCHMCVDRLADGDLPACVAACPTSAIEIEAVDVAEWRRAIDAADAPGVPPADLTLSTTRITLPDDLPVSMGSTDAHVLAPEHPHWSLVIFLVLSQMSVGLFGAAAALELLAPAAGLSASVVTTLAAFAAGQVASLAALFHLGRPVHALRAMRAWRHSWLSREVVAFALFGAASALPATMALSRLLWGEAGALLSSGALVAALVAAVATGLAGIASSAGIYLIPARPAWDSRRTPAQFFVTAVLLGSTGLLSGLTAFGDPLVHTVPMWISAALVSATALASAGLPWSLALEGLTTEGSLLRGAAILLTRRFGRLFKVRTAALCAAACLAPAATLCSGTIAAPVLAGALTAVCVAAEVCGRYLFFVTVVPRNMPGSFFGARSE